MGYSAEHTARTRARILASARRLFKAQGVNDVSVDAVMADAGLTRGGFYAHFKSKEALVAEALAETPVLDLLHKHPRDAEWAQRVLSEYVGPLHRDHRASGCPLAALAADAERAGPAVRHAYTESLETLVAELETRLGGRAKALATLAMLLGGITLARTVDDTGLSDEILAACRAALAEAA